MLFSLVSAIAVGCVAGEDAESDSLFSGTGVQANGEIVLFESDVMNDIAGRPAGVIDEARFWPFFRVPTDLPANVGDYTFEARLEVFSKPTTKTTSMQILLWQDSTPGDGKNDKKNEIGGPKFEFAAPGVFTKTRGTLFNWSKIKGTFDTARMVDAVSGIATKADNKCPVHRHAKFVSCGGWAVRAEYHPIEYRLSVIGVPPGATFSGWDAYLAANP